MVQDQGTLQINKAKTRMCFTKRQLNKLFMAHFSRRRGLWSEKGRTEPPGKTGRPGD